MRHLFYGVMILLILTALVGCGSVPTPTPTPTSEPPTETPVTEPPTATPEPPTATPEPPTATPEPPTPTPIPEGVVNAEPYLNMRSGPSTEFDVLGTIPTGSRVTILEANENNTWLKVNSAENGEGWVAAEFIDIGVQPGAQPGPTEQTAEATTEPAAPPVTADNAPTAEPVPPTATVVRPATPVPGGDIDEYINTLFEGTFNRLSDPVAMGAVPAGGKVELVIANDSPFALKINLGNPANTNTTLDACQDCTVYETEGPGSCPPEKPQKTLRIDPGALRLAIETSSPDIAPHLGEWTLEGNQKYSLCFYVVRSLLQ